jgi:hypothetical protein
MRLKLMAMKAVANDDEEVGGVDRKIEWTSGPIIETA